MLLAVALSLFAIGQAQPHVTYITDNGNSFGAWQVGQVSTARNNLPLLIENLNPLNWFAPLPEDERPVKRGDLSFYDDREKCLLEIIKSLCIEPTAACNALIAKADLQFAKKPYPPVDLVPASDVSESPPPPVEVVKPQLTSSLEVPLEPKQ